MKEKLARRARAEVEPTIMELLRDKGPLSPSELLLHIIRIYSSVDLEALGLAYILKWMCDEGKIHVVEFAFVYHTQIKGPNGIFEAKFGLKS